MTRDTFLQRVREAVRAGNRPGSTAPVEARGGIGYQGAGPDLVAHFRQEFMAAGGQFHAVHDSAAASARVLELVQARSVRRVLVGGGRLVNSLSLSEPLRALGIEITAVDALVPENSRTAFFSADIGISGVDYLVAETGTIVLQAQPEQPRSLSLLPPVHIAIAEPSQLLPDLFDLFEIFGSAETASAPGAKLPSCLTLITGPSKTGDIELRLVTGVHGPGEVHLIFVGG